MVFCVWRCRLSLMRMETEREWMLLSGTCKTKPLKAFHTYRAPKRRDTRARQERFRYTNCVLLHAVERSSMHVFGASYHSRIVWVICIVIDRSNPSILSSSHACFCSQLTRVSYAFRTLVIVKYVSYRVDREHRFSPRLRSTHMSCSKDLMYKEYGVGNF